jgi:hypothetical protein
MNGRAEEFTGAERRRSPARPGLILDVPDDVIAALEVHGRRRLDPPPRAS